jgi:hypothetical protein
MGERRGDKIRGPIPGIFTSLTSRSLIKEIGKVVKYQHEGKGEDERSRLISPHGSIFWAHTNWKLRTWSRSKSLSLYHLAHHCHSEY